MLNMYAAWLEGAAAKDLEAIEQAMKPVRVWQSAAGSPTLQPQVPRSPKSYHHAVTRGDSKGCKPRKILEKAVAERVAAEFGPYVGDFVELSRDPGSGCPESCPHEIVALGRFLKHLAA